MSILVAAWVNRTPGRSALPAFGLGVGLTLAIAIALVPLSWATLLVAGGIVVVMTLLYPALGVLLIVPAVPFGALRQVQLGVMNVGATEALVALVLAAWLMRMIARREIRVQRPPLFLPMCFLLGAMLLSVLNATSVQYSFKELVKWIEVLALYVMVFNEMRGRWLRALLFVLLGTGTLAAAHGIYQFLFQSGPEAFVLFGRFMRAFGTFDQPNPYGGYLGLVLPLAIGIVVAAIVPVAGRVDGRWLVWAAGCGAVVLAALIMTWSRGAWLGLGAAVALMVISVVVRSGRAAVLITVFAVLVAYLLVAGGLARVPPSVVQRFSDFLPYLGMSDVRGLEVTDANFAVLERFAHWQSALAMWADHPWLGVGVGNYEPAYARYALPQWPLPLGHAHNYYLNIAAEAGLLGLASYVFLWGAAGVGAWRVARQATGWHWGVALGILGVITHLSIHNLFDNLYVHGMYLHVAILLGIVPFLHWRSADLGPN